MADFNLSYHTQPYMLLPHCMDAYDWLFYYMQTFLMRPQAEARRSNNEALTSSV